MRRASITIAATSSPATAAKAIQRLRRGVMAGMVHSMEHAVCPASPPHPTPTAENHRKMTRRLDFDERCRGALQHRVPDAVMPIGRQGAGSRSAAQSGPSFPCSARCSTCRTRPLWSPRSYRPDARICWCLPFATSSAKRTHAKFGEARGDRDDWMCETAHATPEPIAGALPTAAPASYLEAARQATCPLCAVPVLALALAEDPLRGHPS